VASAAVELYSSTQNAEQVNDFFYYNSATFQITMSPSCTGGANLCLQFSSLALLSSVTVQPCQTGNPLQQFGFLNVPPPASNSAYGTLATGGNYYVVPLSNPNLCMGVPYVANGEVLLLYNCSAPTGAVQMLYNRANFAPVANPLFTWNVYGGSCVASAQIELYYSSSTPEQINDFFYYNPSTYQITMSASFCPGYCLQLNTVQIGGSLTIQPCQSGNAFQQFGFINSSLPFPANGYPITTIIPTGSSTGSSGTSASITNNSSNNGLGGGAIAGIVIGSVVGAAVLCLLCVCIFMAGTRRKESTKTTESGATHSFDPHRDVSERRDTASQVAQHDVEMETTA